MGNSLFFFFLDTDLECNQLWLSFHKGTIHAKSCPGKVFLGRLAGTRSRDIPSMLVKIDPRVIMVYYVPHRRILSQSWHQSCLWRVGEEWTTTWRWSPLWDGPSYTGCIVHQHPVIWWATLGRIIWVLPRFMSCSTSNLCVLLSLCFDIPNMCGLGPQIWKFLADRNPLTVRQVILCCVVKGRTDQFPSPTLCSLEA